MHPRIEGDKHQRWSDAMGSDESLLSQRSIWGVNPQVVETILAEHEREGVSYRARIADLEARVSAITTQRDETMRRTSSEQATVQGQIAELESRLSMALAQARASEEELAMLRESADRINVLREEAVQVVADAWAMAQAIEERTRNELMAEAAKGRAQLEDEKARHRTEMDRLGKQRVQMLMQLEATARAVLDHATLIKGGEAAPDFTSSLDIALQTLNPDHDHGTRAATYTTPYTASPPSPPLIPSPPVGPLILPPAQVDDGPKDAVLLSNALDELEALLSAPKDRTQSRANNTKLGEDLLNRLRGT